MGFWQGMNEGLTYVLDRKAAEEADEKDRAFRREEYQRRLRDEKLTAALPLILKKREEQLALSSQRAVLGNYFEDRLTGEDVPDETRAAFTNLATQDPTYATSLIETIDQTEAAARRKLSGSEIIKMSQLLEKTKPENIALEDWIKQASGMVVADESGIDFDETLSRLISGDISDQDLLEVQTEIMRPVGSSLGLLPDFDTTSIIGLDPAKGESLRKTVLGDMKLQLENDLRQARSRVEQLQTGGTQEDIKAAATKFEELQRLTLEEDSDSAIFNYYAPLVLPQIATRQPEVRDYFPQYFTQAIEFDFVGGQLVPVNR
jgi:hypothetical protein